MAAGEPLNVRELSIGEFARRTRLPVSTLRYYHELGVLIPARVDEQTGYRYYIRDQIETAAIVATLRELGVAPAELTEVSAGSRRFEDVLIAHRDHLQSEVAERAKAIARIEALLAVGSSPRQATVVFERRLEQRVPAAFGQVATGDAERAMRRLAVRLRATLRQAGADDPTWYGALLPLDLDVDPIPTTVFANVERPVLVQLPDAVLPGGDFAVATHTASNGWLAYTYQAVLDWAQTHGRSPARCVIEEYRPDGSVTIAVQLNPVEP